MSRFKVRYFGNVKFVTINIFLSVPDNLKKEIVLINLLLPSHVQQVGFTINIQSIQNFHIVGIRIYLKYQMALTRRQGEIVIFSFFSIPV